MCTYMHIFTHRCACECKYLWKETETYVQGCSRFSWERERQRERERDKERERESSDQQIVKRFSYPQNKINHTSPYGWHDPHVSWDHSWISPFGPTQFPANSCSNTAWMRRKSAGHHGFPTTPNDVSWAWMPTTYHMDPYWDDSIKKVRLVGLKPIT